MSLLKILLTNYCIYDCLYCVNRVSSNVPRARFTTEEVVRLTLDFYSRNYIEGTFLSSGIIRDPDYTMEQVVAVARALRHEHQFRGYIHLKTIPEAHPDLITEAGRLADRISINIELPTQADLHQLAPEKNHARIERTMGVIRTHVDESKQEARRNASPSPSASAASRSTFAPAGQSTQMVIGATPATDRVVLDRSNSLYQRFALRRVYYSAFSPIPDSSRKLPLVAPPLVRERRLYQADWLMRFYEFEPQELTTTEEPNLDLVHDPKLSWALRHRGEFPVDVNTAPRHRLLRVPGFGVKNVDRLLQARRFQTIRLDDLARLRIPLRKALPFITTPDHTPHRARLDNLDLRTHFAPPVRQLELFAADATPATAAAAVSGQF